MSQEVGTIVNLYRGYENEHSNSEYLKEADLSEVFKFVMGMTYEQFKYQNIAWSIQNFCRNYHILVGSKNINREMLIARSILMADIIEIIFITPASTEHL